MYLEASVATVNGAARSGRWRTGFYRKRDLRVLKDIWQGEDQFQGSFLVNNDEGSGNVGVVRDEVTVEVSKTKD